MFGSLAQIIAAPAGDNTATWLLVATLVLGNGAAVTVLLTALVNRRQNRATRERTESESGKHDAEATEALVRTSLSLLQPYTEGLARFGDEAARLREENALLRSQHEQMAMENEALKAEQDRMRRDNDDLTIQLAALKLRVAAITEGINGAEEQRDAPPPV